MRKLIAFTLISLFAANAALARAPAAKDAKPAVAPAVTPAKPATTPAIPAEPAKVAPAPVGDCEARAVSKAGKPLHGAARMAFMKKCEKGHSPAAAGKSAPQSRMAVCNQEATGKKGAERKAFMKKCLSK